MIQDLAAQSTAFGDSSPAAQMPPNPFASSLPSSASTQSPAASLPGKFPHMSPGSAREVHPVLASTRTHVGDGLHGTISADGIESHMMMEPSSCNILCRFGGVQAATKPIHVTRMDAE